MTSIDMWRFACALEIHRICLGCECKCHEKKSYKVGKRVVETASRQIETR